MDIKVSNNQNSRNGNSNDSNYSGNDNVYVYMYIHICCLYVVQKYYATFFLKGFVTSEVWLDKDLCWSALPEALSALFGNFCSKAGPKSNKVSAYPKPMPLNLSRESARGNMCISLDFYLAGHLVWVCFVIL